jgi:ADP-ribose pyrophosphatase
VKPLKTEVAFETPWFQLVGKTLREGETPYYSLKVLDYSVVLALTESGEVLVVRQYRPAVERETVEFPCGLVDAGETPLQAIRRELLEETAYEGGEWTELGGGDPDTGRLGNRIWNFVARGVKPAAGRVPEAGITVERWKPDELVRAVLDGRFDHSLHLATLLLAMWKGGVKLPLGERG